MIIYQKVFKLDLNDSVSFSYLAIDKKSEAIKWHHTNGHIGKERLNRLDEEFHLGALNKLDYQFVSPLWKKRS